MRIATKGLAGVMALSALFAASARATTVRAEHDGSSTSVALADGSAEANRLQVRLPAHAREIRIRDASNPILAEGRRCEQGPLGSFRVDCLLDGELYFELDLDAGGGDDEITSKVEARYPGFRASFVRILGGPGDDTIDTGRAEDTIDPGPGEDSVHAGPGYDFIVAGALDDGPDLYDGGPGGATISYAERTRPTSVLLDGLANDGALGEGDNVIGAFGATGGSARDTFTGDGHRNYLFGGRGPDRLRGRGGNDSIMGDAGADRINAGPGNDLVLDAGSPGVDIIDCGPGRDLYEADARDVTIDCEVSLAGGRAPKAEAQASAAKG